MRIPHPSSPALDMRPRIIQPDPACTARRHRHSISGQMSYFKLLGYNVSKKLTGSANSLFSTAVISGSSSAPNLKDMVPPHASAVAGECLVIRTVSANVELTLISVQLAPHLFLILKTGERRRASRIEIKINLR